MDDECHWTQAQKDAFELIERTIREHFDAGVFYVSAEINPRAGRAPWVLPRREDRSDRDAPAGGAQTAEQAAG